METTTPIQLATLPGSEAIAADLERAVALLRGYDVGRIILFGSVARGDFRPDSDIDLCVVGIPHDKYESVLAVDLDLPGRRVDVVDFQTARGYFRERVLTEGQTLYLRPDRIDDFVGEADPEEQRLVNPPTRADVLPAEIEEGIRNLEAVVTRIRKTRPDTLIPTEVRLSALAYEAMTYYQGMEQIMVRIIKAQKWPVPGGSSSHQDTLDLFMEILNNGGVDATPDEVAVLVDLMKFRHRVAHSYSHSLDEEKVLEKSDVILSYHAKFIALFRRVGSD